METESNVLLNQLQLKHEHRASVLNNPCAESSDGLRIRLRALLVALLGISMSACAFASQPVELELDDDEVAQKLNNVSFARRITKPTIRLVMGYGKLSACVTALTSLLLLVAVMSKWISIGGDGTDDDFYCLYDGIKQQAWWRHGARWLAAPALLVAALEVASDAGDAMICALLRGTSNPMSAIIQTSAAALLVTVEILVWYFIAKFFEYKPFAGSDEDKAEPNNFIQPAPSESLIETNAAQLPVATVD